MVPMWFCPSGTTDKPGEEDVFLSFPSQEIEEASANTVHFREPINGYYLMKPEMPERNYRAGSNSSVCKPIGRRVREFPWLFLSVAFPF